MQEQYAFSVKNKRQSQNRLGNDQQPTKSTAQDNVESGNTFSFVFKNEKYDKFEK